MANNEFERILFMKICVKRWKYVHGYYFSYMCQHIFVFVRRHVRGRVNRTERTRYNIITQIYIESTLTKSYLPFTISYLSYLSNHFETLHRARRYYGRALCKISKWLVKEYISHKPARFHEWILNVYIDTVSGTCCHYTGTSAIKSRVFSRFISINFFNSFIPNPFNDRTQSTVVRLSDF